jgi:hypothetical protein
VAGQSSLLAESDQAAVTNGAGRRGHVMVEAAGDRRWSVSADLEEAPGLAERV